jgi:carbon-monoxide dehydrogenase medium subunit
MYDFNYQRASSVDDAASKHAAADDARYLAGGMTMVPVLKQRLDQPSDVVDLGGLGDLTGISENGGAIVIGAMTTHHDVNTSDLVKSKIPALADLAGTIGDPMVRNRGTIGGSLANNDPAASYPAAVLGLGATIQTNKRSIEADDFFTGMFDTALEEGELITAVSFPVPEQAGYRHFPNPASRFPIVGAFVAQTGGGVRVGITGAAPCAYRQTSFEDALAGGLDPESLKGIEVSSDGMNSDIHASAEYRAHLVNVMARRAIGG